MAEEVIGFKVDVDTGSGAISVGALRQEFIEAREALNQTTKGTEVYEKALLRLANAKNGIQNLNQEIRHLNPERLGHQFVTAGNAIVGGFAAAQGAAALFGGESENVSKALLKVQSAMALLQGFSAIQQGVQAFKALQLSIGATSISLNGLKSALISSGIGAIIILIGTAVAQMLAWRDANIEAEKAVNDHAKALDDFNKSLEAVQESIDKDNRVAVYSDQIRLLEKLIAIGKIKGDSDEQQFIREQQLFEARKLQLIEEDGVLVKYSEKYKKIQDEQEIAIAQHNQNLINNKSHAIVEINSLTEKGFQFGLKQQENYGELGLAKFKSLEKAKADFKERMNNIFLQKEKENAANRIIIEQQVFGALTNLGIIFSKNAAKQAAFQKKLASINIIVQQAEALANAVKSASTVQFPANLVAITTSVASIVAIFAQIKTLFSKAGDIGGAPSLDTGGVTAPSVSAAQSFSPNESTDLTSQGQSTTPPQQDQTVRAWVVESDITMTQDRINKLKTWAKFG